MRMRNRLVNITFTYGIDMLSILVILVTAHFFFRIGLTDIRLFLFFLLFLITLLPAFNYLRDIVDSRISPIRYDDIFARTVDNILNMRSLDDILKETFDQILDFMRIASGILIFYYPDRDEYSIFYQKNKKKRMIRNARIENDNILFKIIKGPDDIISRGKLEAGDNYTRAVHQELDRLHGETIIPIYYQDTFLGVIVTGKRNRKFSSRETGLLKIFASKIAALSINNFFLNEMLKKKELEKEYELASKIHNRFMPEPEMDIGRISVRVHHRTSSLMTREFFDAFMNRSDHNDIRIAGYRLRGDITGTSIYMPGIQALLQSYSKLGFTPHQTVKKIITVMKEREIIDEELAVYLLSINQKGDYTCFNHGYPDPFIYRHSDGSMKKIAATRGEGQSRGSISIGDLIIICGESYHGFIASNAERIRSIIQDNSGISLSKLRGVLTKTLPQRSRSDDRDALLILIRMEEYR